MGLFDPDQRRGRPQLLQRLQAQQIESHVVDPASILGPQRRRKVKTDRIGACPCGGGGGGAKQVRRLAA
jgi:hypothetical protein